MTYPTIQVTDLQRSVRNTAASLVYGTDGHTATYWEATVEAGELTLSCTRYDHEGEWIIDAAFKGCFPVFANGSGSRCTILKVAAPDVQSALNEALADWISDREDDDARSVQVVR